MFIRKFDRNAICLANEELMQILSRGELIEGQATYINDSIGLHRVENLNHTERAMTLHLHTPLRLLHYSR